MKCKFTLILLFFAFIAGSANAQSMKKWTWAAQKMSFEVPANLKVKESSATKFSGTSTAVSMSIYPRKGEAIGQDQMRPLLRKWARTSKISFDGEIQYMDDHNGYWGAQVEGFAENGNPTSLLLLVDPDFPEISFYVWLQYQESAGELAMKVLDSFKPM